MQQEKHAVQDAHVAELELQSEQYAELAAKLRKREALASAQEHQVTAAQVGKILHTTDTGSALAVVRFSMLILLLRVGSSTDACTQNLGRRTLMKPNGS